jgi:hypothetical protein
MAAATIAQSPSGSLALPSYHQVPETTHECALLARLTFAVFKLIRILVDWATLATLDLSRFDEPGGKQLLAQQLSDAIQNIGKVPRFLRT